MLLVLVYEVCGSVWAVDFFAFADHVVTFNAGLELSASVAISTEHFAFSPRR
jgi:hypothetical protein